jgi:GT2 family glycosyltransferase
MPSVSLYVPCYNGAPWLAECLDSLLAQSRPADEVLVVDDGSTDDSAAIARSFGPRVRLHSHPRNLGLAVARNTALGACRGEIVASVDADVRASPAWLSRLLGGFTSPRVAAVGGRLVEHHQSTLPDRWRAAHMVQHAGDFPLLDPPVLPGANVAVRRDLLRALGGYDESFRTNYEDADLQHRLLARGYRCRYQPGAVAYHLRRDSAQSVLRTYWGWLRPPFERQGAYRNAGDLVRKDAASAGFAGRALWQDLAGGDPQVAYLSLLVLLAFPAADRAHAARLALEAGDAAGSARFAAAARAWPVAAPMALRDRSPALAARAGGDLAYLSWWGPALEGIPEVSSEDGPGDLGPLPATVRGAVEALPRAWWPALESSRQRLAAAEGWPLGPPALTPNPATPALAALARVSARVLGGAGPDVQALILHGAAGRGEHLPWAPLELLLVVRRPLPPGQHDRLRRELATHLGGLAGPPGAEQGAASGPQVETVEGHRLGWMAPGLLQQSLLAGAVLLWGDGAVLGAIPSWPPERLDPRLALAEARGAADDLGAGRFRLAVARAAGALLLARRAYSPWHAGRADTVRRLWPEAPVPPDTTAERFVSLAGELVRRWLFTWEGAAAPPVAVERFRSLLAAAAAAPPLSGAPRP